MNAGEVYNLLRSLIDETDETFLTPANTNTYLKQGHSEFRLLVTGIDPEYYIERTFMSPLASTSLAIDLTTGANFVDGNPILGPAAVAANKLMSRMVRMGVVDDATKDTLSYYMIPCNSALAVQRGEGNYCISGQNLVLGSDFTGTTIRMEFLRDPIITWTSVATDYIDDLAAHHPLIALYAAQYYAIRDGAENIPLLRQMARKEQELKEYLTTGRLSEGAHYITPQLDLVERY